ncbi:MAG TPA: CHRD domain-containing protein [Gaiellaceae bacterium]|nr:CHRD domain-containing protein [Gaiellaceae bacterium]
MSRTFAVAFAFATAVLAALFVVSVATGGQPPATNFSAVLTAEDEVPLCATATNASRGHFAAHVVDATAGTVEWTLVANNLPGDIVASHIHRAPFGVAGPVVQPLPPTPGAENGVIGTGSFTNLALVADMQLNPQNYYVNVHTAGAGGCPPGAIRGQLDEHGPSNN